MNGSFDCLDVYNLSCVNEIIDPATIHNLSILYNRSLNNARIVNLEIVSLSLRNISITSASFQALIFLVL